jgi:site-specific DNA-methyltransferase (adenine-specific)
MKTNIIYNKPAQDGLRLLPTNSIDLTVTSPPYDNLRDYNGYSFPFELIAKELFRVTKNGGVVVWVVSDETIKFNETGTSFKQALYFKEIGFNLLDTMIYGKQNYAPAYPTMRRYAQTFEYMFVLSKTKPNVFKPKQVEKVRNKIEKGCKTRNKNGTQNKSKLIIPTKSTKDACNIWMYPTEKAKDAGNHPAVFPEQLAKDHINSWSNENDIILDPFMGSGTTAKVAHLLNRKFIGFEMSKEYCEIIEKRMAQFTDLFSELGSVLDYS